MRKLSDIVKNNKILILIIFFAAFLRFYALGSNPPSLNWDEASHGYNAYSILLTVKDEWGETLPLIFRAYGDYKLPVYIYTTIVSVAVFGLTEFAVRIPSALSGVGTVVFTYLLVIELFGRNKKDQLFANRKTLASIAAFLVAVEPWSLFLSRGAFEANLALMLFTGGIYFFLKGSQKPIYLTLCVGLWGLTVWTYNSYRIFTPLMMMVIAYLWRSEVVTAIRKKPVYLFVSLFLFLFLFVPMLLQLTVTSGQARYSRVAIIDEGAVASINEQRALADYHPLVERLIYNKAIFFTRTVAGNWLQHYSPLFLHIQGGSQYQYSVQGHGLIYLVNFPLLVIGLGILIAKAVKKDRPAILLLTWFLLAPLAASITRDSPHALRAITTLPVPMIIISLGVYWFADKIDNNYLKKLKLGKYTNNWKMFLFSVNRVYLTYILTLTVLLTNYLYVYFQDYRVNYSWSWQYGYKEAVSFTKEAYDIYDKIIVTKKYGEPHIFYLFYWPWNPQDYMDNDNLVRFEQTDWYWVDRFDKFYFVNDWEIPTRSDQDFVLESGEEFDCRFSKCLLVTSPGTHQQDWKLLETVYFLDGEPAFEILNNKMN